MRFRVLHRTRNGEAHLLSIMIDLFPHNLRAYKSAVNMLDETGRSAIIHPTGTGKSFIAFKLCEDNADKRILWASPSEYIFKTQVENVRSVSNEFYDCFGHLNITSNYSANGDLAVPQKHITPDGFFWGRCLAEQRKKFKKGKLDKRRAELLTQIGFAPNTADADAIPATNDMAASV